MFKGKIHCLGTGRMQSEHLLQIQASSFAGFGLKTRDSFQPESFIPRGRIPGRKGYLWATGFYFKGKDSLYKSNSPHPEANVAEIPSLKILKIFEKSL